MRVLTLVKMPYCWKSHVATHFNSIMYIIITRGSLVIIIIQVKVVTECSKFHSLRLGLSQVNLDSDLICFIF